jgi:pyridoxamine 5'-phosphate oxidase-like protein
LEDVVSQQLYQLDETHKEFIKNQHLFFVGTAGVDGRVNISPKGMDSLRVIDSKKIVWLNYTGSGNETAAHVLECCRMTLMFCAFTGKPQILRIYGKARAVHPRDADWEASFSLFPTVPGARQIFSLEIESVATSCGYSVPLYDHVGERDVLVKWAEKKGEEGVKKYWQDNNQKSIDGKPTGLFE